jgi:hypothetical protein
MKEKPMRTLAALSKADSKYRSQLSSACMLGSATSARNLFALLRVKRSALCILIFG